jgi:hypothetical protein
MREITQQEFDEMIETNQHRLYHVVENDGQFPPNFLFKEKKSDKIIIKAIAINWKPPIIYRFYLDDVNPVLNDAIKT